MGSHDNGSFLLDTTERLNRNPLVTDITGTSGEARFRNLHLLEKPWGIDREQLVIPKFSEESTYAQLKATAKARGQKQSGSYVVLLKRLEDWKEARRTELPLAYLTRAYTAAEAGIEFFEDEVVCVIGFELDEDRKVPVLDFEENRGLVLANETDIIEKPFDSDAIKASLLAEKETQPVDVGTKRPHSPGKDVSTRKKPKTRPARATTRVTRSTTKAAAKPAMEPAMKPAKKITKTAIKTARKTANKAPRKLAKN